MDYGARWYDAGIGRFSTIDRFAEKYSPMTAYQYGANNPVKFIDVNGDSIRWAQDEASQLMMQETLALRNQSTIFKGIYDYLDKNKTIINVRANDNAVQMAYQKATKGKDPSGRAGGMTSPDGQRITLSDVEGNITTNISEEFFHSFQIVGIYSRERASQELDSEAKLFNATILQEIENTGSSLQGELKVISDISSMLGMSYANYNNGNLSVPLLEAADKGSLIISESSPAFKSYKSYLNSFNASHDNPNDPYNGKQRNLIPAAFNSAILLNRSNRK